MSNLVRTGVRPLFEVEFGDGEVLAEHRQRAGGSRSLQIGNGATEAVDIGQHRKT